MAHLIPLFRGWSAASAVYRFFAASAGPGLPAPPMGCDHRMIGAKGQCGSAHRNVCRLPVWPAPLQRSFENINMEIFGTMWGPNEFTCIGNLKNWSCLGELGRLTQPVLLISGYHDEMTPPVVSAMKHALPNAEVKIFPNSSHTPYFEERDDYFRTVQDFLDRHREAPASARS